MKVDIYRYVFFQGHNDAKLLIASDYPKPNKYIISFERIKEKWIGFEGFVAQAIALSSDVENYPPHKCGSSYEVLSMMSFENIHKIYYMKSSYRFLLFDKL